MVLAVLILPAGVQAQNLGYQLRVSQAGPDGSAAFAAWNPSAAFGSAAGRYLVVWHADDSQDEKYEIFGRLIGADGGPIGGEFKIGSAGGAGDTTRVAAQPRVAYNSRRNEFAVVWSADDSGVDNDQEIWAQRVGPGGELVGARVRVSDMGINNAEFNGDMPQIAFSHARDEFLVVWHGRHSSLGPENNEVWSQRLNGDLVRSNPSNVRVSNQSVQGTWPTVAFNPAVGEYLVAFIGDGGAGQHVTVQRVDAATGGLIGSNKQVHTRLNSHKPAVAANPDNGHYLVAWPGVAPGGDTDIYVQRLGSDAGEIGLDDQRISDMGPENSTNFVAGVDVAIGYSTGSKQFLVAWAGDDDAYGGVDEEWEVVGQLLDAGATEIGLNDFPISAMGPRGTAKFRVASRELLTGPLAVNPSGENWLVPYNGDDSTAPLVDNELEVFLRFVTPLPSPPSPPPPPPPPSDRDGDGVPDPADACPDAHHGNRDANGDGCPDAVAVVARFGVSFVANRRTKRITKLVVGPLLPGTKITVLCVKGCKKKKGKSAVLARGKAPKRRGASKTLKIKRRLRHGHQLEVRLTRPGFLGRYAVIKVLRKAPFGASLVSGCLAPQNTHMPCP